MPVPSMPPPPLALGRRTTVLMGAAVIVAGVVATYWGGMSGGFLFDDVGSISGNPSIHHLAASLSPPAGATVSGRPFLNFTFAVNFALGGMETRGFHGLNIAIHAGAALILLGVLRRSLATPAGGARQDGEGLLLAFSIALLWALHPMQTESVAYVVQRAESLVGLLYLGTLYAFIRHAEGGAAAPFWAAGAVALCLLGMATKEVMATAPVIVFLYDRTFLAGSFREAWRRRKALHLALAGCWLPLGYLVATSGGRSGTAGFGSGVSWWSYFEAQFHAVPHYLGLAFWPHPLVGDYGRVLVLPPVQTVVGGAFMVFLVVVTCVLLRHKPGLGFVGTWFLLILAPSSSVIPVATEIIAEHRMYLPLAAVATLAVMALRAWTASRTYFLAAVGASAAVLAGLTVQRNRVYESPHAFWSDVVLRAPGNAGAWNNLGALHAADGDAEGAIPLYRRSLDLAPDYATAHFNLGRAYFATGDARRATDEFEAALRADPLNPSLHAELGKALALGKQAPAAAAQYRAALRLDPNRADAWFNLGDALVQVGDLPKAAEAYSHAVRLSPDYAQAHVNYGDVLVQTGRAAEAVVEYEAALRLNPGSAEVHNNLGSLFAQAGDFARARVEYEKALRLDPDYREARENLGRVGAQERRGATR